MVVQTGRSDNNGMQKNSLACVVTPQKKSFALLDSTIAIRQTAVLYDTLRKHRLKIIAMYMYI